MIKAITNDGFIVCGFSGIGKSYCGEHIKDFVDLNSTGFEKNWKIYADIAEKITYNNGLMCACSCHTEIRNEFNRRKIPYIVVYPEKSSKNEYIERWINRGSTPEFIGTMSNNWDKYIESCEEDENEMCMDKIEIKNNKFLFDYLMTEEIKDDIYLIKGDMTI